MTQPTPDDLEEARRPIASLITKSEKAQQKLPPGAWQHSMLRDMLKALRIANVLMNDEACHPNSVTRDDLQEALAAFAAMIRRIGQAEFTPGTPQHTLQQNRLKALRVADAVTKMELNARNS